MKPDPMKPDPITNVKNRLRCIEASGEFGTITPGQASILLFELARFEGMKGALEERFGFKRDGDCDLGGCYR